MPYAWAVVERTMKVQEVMLQALSGKLTWLQAEEILGWRPRTLRRWRLRYQRVGYDGLWDRRRQQPSPRRAPGGALPREARAPLHRPLSSDPGRTPVTDRIEAWLRAEGVPFGLLEPAPVRTSEEAARERARGAGA